MKKTWVSDEIQPSGSSKATIALWKPLGWAWKYGAGQKCLLFSGLKGGHTCFFSAVSMQVAENDFGMIAEIVFRKSHFKLISRLPANGTSTLLAKARNWSFDLSGFANWKEEASKDQIFATTEFRTSKKTSSWILFLQSTFAKVFRIF